MVSAATWRLLNHSRLHKASFCALSYALDTTSHSQLKTTTKEGEMPLARLQLRLPTREEEVFT